MSTNEEIIENLRNELEKLRNDRCEGYIFEYGLPPINDNHNAVASSSSKTPGLGKHITRSGLKIKAEEKSFGILKEIYDEKWMKNPCIQWQSYRKK